MNDINYIIFKVLSKEATLEEKEEFDNWLKADISNSSEFVKLQTYWKAKVVYDHGIQVDAAFNRFKKNKLSLVRSKSGTVRQIFIGILSAAAVALLLFTVGLPKTSPKDNFTFATNDKKDTLYLPDSSKIILNKYSKVNYSSQYNKSERLIKLVGEAYFDVKKNAKVPFIVKMEKCQITVLGTAFNVRAYAKETSVKASLIRGVIQFDANEKENEKETENQITLRPNQELRYNKLTDDISIKHVDAGNSLLWMNDLHKYLSKPLSYFLNDLGVIYNKQINLSDKELANTVISGSFRNDQSLEEVLRIISRSVPIQWEIDADTIKISSN